MLALASFQVSSFSLSLAMALAYENWAVLASSRSSRSRTSDGFQCKLILSCIKRSPGASCFLPNPIACFSRLPACNHPHPLLFVLLFCPALDDVHKDPLPRFARFCCWQAVAEAVAAAERERSRPIAILANDIYAILIEYLGQPLVDSKPLHSCWSSDSHAVDNEDNDENRGSPGMGPRIRQSRQGSSTSRAFYP